MYRGSSSKSSVSQCCHTLTFQIFIMRTPQFGVVTNPKNFKSQHYRSPLTMTTISAAPQNLLTLGVKYSLINLLTKSVWVCTFNRCT